MKQLLPSAILISLFCTLAFAGEAPEEFVGRYKNVDAKSVNPDDFCTMQVIRASSDHEGRLWFVEYPRDYAHLGTEIFWKINGGEDFIDLKGSDDGGSRDGGDIPYGGPKAVEAWIKHNAALGAGILIHKSERYSRYADGTVFSDHSETRAELRAGGQLIFTLTDSRTPTRTCYFEKI